MFEKKEFDFFFVVKEIDSFVGKWEENEGWEQMDCCNKR